MATENNIQPTNQLENTIQVTWYTTLCSFYVYIKFYKSFDGWPLYVRWPCEMVASLESTHRPYRYIIQHYLFFFFACKTYSEARKNLFHQLFMLDLVNIDTSLLLCGEVYLPFQININIFQLFINLLRNLIDSPKIYILLLVNYYIIICFAWHTVLLKERDQY